VRDNIGNFGGDPGNVTIFGESGGGAKISTMMAMPKAKGLFHKTIIESGSMLHVSERAEGTTAARAVLAGLGLDEKHLGDLERIPAADLYNAVEKSGALHGPLGFGPVIDGVTVLHQTWDPSAPVEAAGIPLLVGNCKDEITLFVGSFNSDDEKSPFNLDEAGLREWLVDNGIPVEEVGALLALYHRDYPNESSVDLFFRIAADRGARWNATRQAEMKIAQGEKDVYLYSFAWNTPCGDGKLRAFHTAELPLAMRLVAYPESEQLSRQISGAWAAFGRTGNPNHPGLPEWRAYTLEEQAMMIFDAKGSATVNNPDGEELCILRKYPSGSLL